MRKFLPLAVFAGILFAAPATAQWDERAGYPQRGGGEIEWRLDRIYEQIERARRFGEISPLEARELHGEGQWTASLYARYRRDGLSAGEYRELADRTRALRVRVRRGLDRDDGYPRPYPDDLDWYDGTRDDGWSDDRRWSDDDPRADDRWDDRREEDWRQDDPEDWNVRPADEDWRAGDDAIGEEPRNEDWLDDRGDYRRDESDGYRAPTQDPWQDSTEPERVERIDPFDPGSAVDPGDDRWFYGDAPQQD